MKNGWQTKELGDVCDFEGGSQPPKSEFVHEERPGYVRFLQIRDFGSEKNITYIPQSKKNRLCQENDILIGRYGASVGKILTNKSGAYNVALMKTIPNLEVLNKSWFYNYLISDQFQTRLSNVADRSAQAGFSKDDIYSFPIPLPPLPEQRRIVGILDEAFESIATAKANAEKNLQKAGELFLSVLLSAITGEFTKEWRKKYQTTETASSFLKLILAKRRENWNGKGLYTEPTPPSTAGLPFIPDSWTWTNLDQLKSFSLYGPRFSNDDYTDSGVLVLRTSDINEQGKVNSETAPKLAMTPEDFEKYKCKKGDLLITRTGSLGTLAVFNDETHAIPGAYLIQYRLLVPDITPQYLFMFFKSPIGQSRLTAGATGAGRPNLNAPTIEAVPIPFPPLAEQKVIIHKLDSVWAETQRLARLYERKLAALKALKKSLLHRAFAGELTQQPEEFVREAAVA
jgi:type I restriction enzyme S subunit